MIIVICRIICYAVGIGVFRPRQRPRACLPLIYYCKSDLGGMPVFVKQNHEAIF